jgi:hypothetical protein
MTMLANLKPFFGLATDLVRLGASHLKSRRDAEPSETDVPQPVPGAEQQWPTLPTFSPPPLPVLPSLPTLPTLSGLTARAPLGNWQSPTRVTASTVTATVDVAGSYANEIEDLSIACVPCSRSHLSTMAMAAEEGARLAAACDERGARVQWARVVAEAAIMEAFDWTPDKLARARPDDRSAIEEVMPRVKALVARTPAAPRHVILAWASVDESLRFARSPRATEQDRLQVVTRLRLTEDCMNYAERMVLSPEGLETVLATLPEAQRGEARLAGPTMREARHKLVSSHYELEALEFIAAKLQTAVIALTPSLNPQTAAELAREYRAVRVAFDRQVIANMALRNGAKP